MPKDNSPVTEKMLSAMRKRMVMGAEAYSNSRAFELEDLKFLAGNSDNNWQWPSDVMATRGSASGPAINARPCLTINKLPQHVRQVTNAQRQNRPSGKVIPVDDKSDLKLAEIYSGIIRHIEYISDADVAYDTACENQVSIGEGYVRILTEYCDEDSFDQELRIGRIRNSFSVVMDPTIQDPCGADANWCFIFEDMLKEDYIREWPDAAPISSIASFALTDQSMANWLTEDTIRIAEYFYATYERRTLNLWPNGQTSFAGEQNDKMMKAMYGEPKRTRQSDKRVIKWVKTNGYETLEEQDWLGKSIPVVRVIGNEYEVDGELHISGLVRNAKDAQRMYNYWTSQEAEMLALAPKAPFVGYSGQFEGYEAKWNTANVNAWPYLEVNAEAMDGQGNPLPLPQRSIPPMAQTGLIQAKMGAADDIKSTVGQYDSSIGATSNERSGKAIMAREKQSDTGSYHYDDNLARAVRYVSRQLIDLIPKVYDTKRIIRIIGEDSETRMVEVDPEQENAIEETKDEQGVVLKKVYNLGVGKYDVMATTGPSYMTKRQEALEGMAQILQGNKELWNVAGDLFVKYMDWPGAQELAKRLQKMVDPKLLEEADESPALQAAKMKVQEMAQELDQVHGMLENVKKSMDERELQVKEFEAFIKQFDAETKRLATMSDKLTPVQVQDIVAGTMDGILTSAEMSAEAPGQEPDPMVMPQEPPMAPPEIQPQL